MSGELTTIDFHGDTLFAVRRSDGPYIVPKPISDTLGLQWAAQHKRMRRDTILAEGMSIMDIPSPGGAQETIMQPDGVSAYSLQRSRRSPSG